MNKLYLKYLITTSIFYGLWMSIFMSVFDYWQGEDFNLKMFLSWLLIFGPLAGIMYLIILRVEFSKIGMSNPSVEKIKNALNDSFIINLSQQDLIHQLQNSHYFNKTKIFDFGDRIEIQSKTKFSPWGNKISFIKSDENMNEWTCRLVYDPNKNRSLQAEIRDLENMKNIKSVFGVEGISFKDA